MKQFAKLFDQEFERRYAMAQEHIQAHHGWMATAIKDPEKQQSGYITIAVKRTPAEIAAAKANGSSSPWIQRHYTYEDLQKNLRQLLAMFPDRDVYMLANTVYKPRRITEYVRQFRCLWADLDCYKIGMRPERVLLELEREVFGKKLPWPNRVVFSGGEEGGLWLFWDVEPVPYYNKHDATHDRGPGLRWRSVQRQFNYLLREYGADPQAIDPVRVCRLAGTYNSKTDQLAECMIYDDSTRYDLAELAKTYLPDIYPVGGSKEHQRPKKAAVRPIQTEMNYFYVLRQDLLTLCDLRGLSIKGAVGLKGREYMLFLIRHFGEMIHGDRDRALQEALELNASFIEPLPIEEVMASTAPRKGVVYRYKRQTLIDLFEITEEEQRRLQVLIGPAVRQERRRQGWREQQARKRREMGSVPREEKRAEDIQRLADVLRDEPEASLRRLAELTGFGKDKCADLKQVAFEWLSENPHPIIVKLNPLEVFRDSFLEVAAGSALHSVGAEDGGLDGMRSFQDTCGPPVGRGARRVDCGDMDSEV